MGSKWNDSGKNPDNAYGGDAAKAAASRKAIEADAARTDAPSERLEGGQRVATRVVRDRVNAARNACAEARRHGGLEPGAGAAIVADAGVGLPAKMAERLKDYVGDAVEAFERSGDLGAFSAMVAPVGPIREVAALAPRTFRDPDAGATDTDELSAADIVARIRR